MRLCLFEDRGVAFLEPIALTRPAFAMRCGVGTTLQRQCRAQNAEEIGAVVRPHLAELCRSQFPALRINDPVWLKEETPVYVNARWFPPLDPIVDSDRACVGNIGDEIAYIIGAPTPCPGGKPEKVQDWLDSCRAALPVREARGSMFNYLWDAVDHNGEAIRQDFAWFRDCHGPTNQEAAVMGDRGLLVVADGARLEPFVSVDTREGPVLIDAGAVVHSFSRLEGPCYVGKNSWILGAKLRMDSSIGPQCRIGGEVEASIVQSRSNKYHEGFLGHSYVGEWVNLAAGTHTSDLRNDYGMVRTTIAGERIATGRTKVGSYIGDHTKTGLGALLNTGSVVGAFCNVLPNGSLLPQIIPSFCIVRDGQLQERWDLRQSLSTAATVMQRRGCELTEPDRELYYHLYDETSELRRSTIKDAERRRYRKSV